MKVEAFFKSRLVTVAGYYGFTLDVHRYYGFTLELCVSICPSLSIQLYFCFLMITWVNVSGVSPNLVCALILCKICFEIANWQILSSYDKLSACHTSVFLFPDDNFSTYWSLLTKLDMCIDIMEIWFGIANGQISSISESYLPTTR